jgi:hypothetical protein
VNSENGGPAVPAQITPELWASMQAAARAAGLEVAPPDSEKVPGAPTLSLDLGWRRLGIELGGLLRQRNIFLRSGSLGRVNETTGEWQRFDAKNFAGWVEEFVAFSSRGQKTKLSAEQAAMMMSQFTFLDQIRKLEGIPLVTLPVLDDNGRVRWLGKGYDAATSIFTVPVLEYARDWPLQKAVDFLLETYGKFPWMKASEDEELMQNRNFAVHVASMVGVFCKAMFRGGELRPMVLWVANQQGSGKTVLAQSAIAPVFGAFPGAPMPKNDDELRKTLNTAAQAFSPFLFFDDIPFLNSNHLNRFITEARHGDRKMGGDEAFDVPAVTQIFATGNDVKGSRDIALRAMIVELFYAGDLSKREISKEMDAAWLARPEVRRDFLSALAALVVNWDNRRETMGEAAVAMLDGIKGMPRFGAFTRLVSGVVRAACFGDPLQPPAMALDEEVDQMRDLLLAVGEKSEKSMTWQRADIVELARELELCEDLVGIKGDKDLDAAATRRFGYKMRAWRGRELMDSKGRRFTFGHAKTRTGATYPVTFA